MEVTPKPNIDFDLVLIFSDGSIEHIKDIAELIEEKGGYPNKIVISSGKGSQVYNTEF